MDRRQTAEDVHALTGRDNCTPAGNPRSNARISVVVPTYNRGPLVCRAIESALRQTRPPDEIIVVDDGSTDDTRALLARFGPAVTYIRQENAGPSAARNRGVQSASYEWVAFLDSDDLWIPTHLEAMASAVAATSGRALFYFGDITEHDQNGSYSLWERWGFHLMTPFEIIQDAAELVLAERQPMMLQTSLFRKSSYLEHGGLWERVRTGEDTHLFMKLGLSGPVCAVKDAGGVRTTDDTRSNRLSMSLGSHSQDHWRNAILVFEDILKSVPHLDPLYRMQLRSYVGMSHWRLFRLFSNEKQWTSALFHIGRVCLTFPGLLPQVLMNYRRRHRSARESTEKFS